MGPLLCYTAFPKHLSFEVVLGYIRLPDTPGLGIALDEAALAHHPYPPFPARSPRQYYGEGP